MRKSWRVGPQQLGRGRKRGNLQDRFDPWFGARHRVARPRRWRRWGSRRAGPKCSREGYREFRCGRFRCRRRVRICSCCDRGQRYCGDGCSRAARREKQRESQRKYEQTAEARRLHAARQRRYEAGLLLAAAQRQPERDEELPAVDENDPDGQAPIKGRSRAGKEETIREGSRAGKEEAQGVAAARASTTLDRVDPQKMTHQGSLGSACVSQWRASRIASLGPGFFPVRCCFCGAWCRPDGRRGPLRGRHRRRIRPFPGR